MPTITDDGLSERLKTLSKLMDTSCDAFHLYREQANGYAVILSSAADEITRLRTQLSLKDKALEWQTMDNAPLSEWLLLNDDAEGICVARWIDGDWYESNSDEPLREVTHWMPLPPLPDAPAHTTMTTIRR